jgi:hypothetical protein
MREFARQLQQVRCIAASRHLQGRPVWGWLSDQCGFIEGNRYMSTCSLTARVASSTEIGTDGQRLSFITKANPTSSRNYEACVGAGQASVRPRLLNARQLPYSYMPGRPCLQVRTPGFAFCASSQTQCAHACAHACINTRKHLHEGRPLEISSAIRLCRCFALHSLFMSRDCCCDCFIKLAQEYLHGWRPLRPSGQRVKLHYSP